MTKSHITDDAQRPSILEALFHARAALCRVVDSSPAIQRNRDAAIAKIDAALAAQPPAAPVTGCKTCDGSGEIFMGVGGPDDPERCHVCDGTGEQSPAAPVETERRCAKCGELTKSEEALVDGRIWCHPCADAHPRLSAATEHACAKFVMWCLSEGSFQGADVDGGAAQDKAVELGLLTETTYNPTCHGPSDSCEEGDAWYVPTEELVALLSGRAPSGPWRVEVGYKGSGPWDRITIEMGPASGGLVIATVNKMVPEAEASARLLVEKANAALTSTEPQEVPDTYTEICMNEKCPRGCGVPVEVVRSPLSRPQSESK